MTDVIDAPTIPYASKKCAIRISDHFGIFLLEFVYISTGKHDANTQIFTIYKHQILNAMIQG